MRSQALQWVSALAFAGLTVASPLQARLLELDHVEISKSEEGTNLSRTIAVKPGEFIAVTIKNTCPDRFIYSHYSFALGPEEPPPGAVASASGCVLQPKTIQIPHEEKYGGYLLKIDGVETTAQGDKTLKPFQVLISVIKTGWDFEFGSGFTNSWLTDPEFAILTETVDGTEVKTVIRDREAEDDSELGLAAFVHMTHPRVQRFAISLGLGINEGTDLSIFLGPSWRLGGKAFLTAGWNWGPTDRLPNGQKLDQAPLNDNILSNLGKRTDGSFFFALSYTFIGGAKEKIQGPFATPAK